MRLALYCVSCEAAGLAALSKLTSLEHLDIVSLSYWTRTRGGENRYAKDEQAIEGRIWQMIEAQRQGKPLKDSWLVDEPSAEQAQRLAKATALEKEAKALLAEVEKLRAKADKLMKEARRLRAPR